MPTGFTSLRIGKGFTSGLRDTAIAIGVGYMLISGNIYTERAQNPAPKQYLGSGAYIGYTDVPCTNTGGLTKYTHCSIQNTTGTTRGVTGLSGTATILFAVYDSYKAPNGPQITCRTSSDGNATGSVLRNVPTTSTDNNGLFYGRSSSGKTLKFDGSGSILLPPSWYLDCWANKTPDTSLGNNTQMKNATLGLYFRSQLIP